MKNVIMILLFTVILGISTSFAKELQKVEGYTPPKICDKNGNRCILKKLYNSKYWCVKSDHQRTLDARRTTQPIKKTYRENIGNCDRTIPIQD